MKKWSFTLIMIAFVLVAFYSGYRLGRTVEKMKHETSDFKRS